MYRRRQKPTEISVAAYSVDVSTQWRNIPIFRGQKLRLNSANTKQGQIVDGGANVPLSCYRHKSQSSALCGLWYSRISVPRMKTKKDGCLWVRCREIGNLGRAPSLPRYPMSQSFGIQNKELQCNQTRARCAHAVNTFAVQFDHRNSKLRASGRAELSRPRVISTPSLRPFTLSPLRWVNGSKAM